MNHNGERDDPSRPEVYNCRVRLGGSLLHEVPKERISGEEVRLLRHIHGDDAIVDLRELGTLEGYTRDEELNSLADRFAQEADKRDGRKLVEKVFGVSLDDFDRWLLNKGTEAEDHAEQRPCARGHRQGGRQAWHVCADGDDAVMAFRATFGSIVEMARSEARLSSNSSRGIDHLDHVKQLVKRIAQSLADDFEWGASEPQPRLQTSRA